MVNAPWVPRRLRARLLRARSRAALGAVALTGALALSGCGGHGHTGPGSSPTPSVPETTTAAIAVPDAGDFPGCTDSTCKVYDAAQVDHPRQGPLLLALVAKRAKSAGDAYGANARMYAVNGEGTITDPYGAKALAPDNPKQVGSHYGYFFGIEYAHPARQVHFMKPARDASGGVFFEIENKEESSTPPALRIDPAGYFQSQKVTTNLSDAFMEQLPGMKWGAVDSRGYYTIRVNYMDNSGADKSLTLHKRGSTYVRE